MIKAYIIAKWSLYALFGIPAVAYSVIEVFHISEAYLYYIMAATGIIAIIFALNEKYTNIDIEILNASKRFEKGVGLVYFGHAILFLLYLIMKWQPVLSFFGLPVLLTIIFFYTKGLSMASEEIENYKQAMQNQDSNA